MNERAGPGARKARDGSRSTERSLGPSSASRPGSRLPGKSPPAPTPSELSCAGNRGRNSRGARCHPAPFLWIRARLCLRGGQGSGGPGGTPGPDSAGGREWSPLTVPPAQDSPRPRRPGGRGAPKLDPSPGLGTSRADPGHGRGLLLGLPRGPQHRAALPRSRIPRAERGGTVPGVSSAPPGPLPASRRAPALPGPP